MEKSEIKAAIMSSVSSEIDLWLGEMDQCNDGYDFEDKLLKRFRNVGKIMMEKSVGIVPKSRNKKNSKPVLAK